MKQAAATDGLLSYARALHDQNKSGVNFEEIDARLRHNDQIRLKDE